MEELLSLQDLSVEYRTGNGTACAVNHLDFTIGKGEAVGLVGESGAGKTTTALSIMSLLPDQVGFVSGGDILFHGESMREMNEKQLGEIRGKSISMIFQNPLTSLNPVFTVGHQISMVIKKHEKVSSREAEKRAGEMLEMVGIPAERMKDYPHQFSGGMRQRVGIAAALACSPELLIADEPTTALDVTIQAQILELMKSLQSRYDTSLLMITHNLGIIAELCGKVAIMYGGSIVEYGSVEEVFTHPAHWYTIGLLNAIPKLSGERERLSSIHGNVANAMHLPDGCMFHPRCAHCTEACERNMPAMTQIGGNHFVRCFHTEV